MSVSKNISSKPIWDNYLIEYTNITQEQLNNLLSVAEIMDIYDNFRERWFSTKDIPGEVWVSIDNLNERYSVSCYGRIRENSITYLETDKNGIIQRKVSNLRILNGYILNRSKYPEVIINKKHYTIHRLVATHFIKKYDDDFDIIDHKNTIRTCAHIFNLWWCNSKLNSKNPITQRYNSLMIHRRFEYPEPDINASVFDNIEDYMTLEKIFSSRMLTDVDFYGEEWKYLYLYNIYVSNLGRIKKYIEDDNKFVIIKQVCRTFNYLSIRVNGSNIFVHYLVLYAFGIIKNVMRYENNMTIDHINTKPYDNRLCNLRYVTLKENVANPSTRENMSNSYNKDYRKTVLLIYSASNKKFEMEIDSMHDAVTILNIPLTTIFNYIGKNKPVRGKWYIIEKTKDEIDEYINIEEPEDNYNKKIGQYDKYGHLVKVYGNVYLINDHNSSKRFYWDVIKCCKTESGILNNYQWRFYVNQTKIDAYKAPNENFINSYDINTGEFLKSFLNAKEAAEYYQVIKENIYNCCNLITSKLRKYNITFRYVNDFEDKRKLFEIVNYNPDDFKSTFVKYSKEKINKYDLLGHYIETYSNIECFESTKERTLILKCCSGKHKMFNNFLWKFTKECNGTEDIEPYKTVIRGLTMKVNQYDYNGNFIRQFDSCRELSKSFNMASPMFNNHMNSYSKETIYGFYYRYTANPNNKLNLWQSGLFNGSNNAKDVVEISKYVINKIDETTDSIIDIYDAIDGFIIKRYYDKILCAKELNTSIESIINNNLINEKYYVKINKNSSDINIKIELNTTSNECYEDNTFINDRERRAQLNNIVVFNYYTKEELGTYYIDDAITKTGVERIAIINCCEGIYKSFINIQDLEEYAFCYECDKEVFVIEHTNMIDELYALYLVETEKLFHVFYSKAELNDFIGYDAKNNMRLRNGKYYFKIYHVGEKIEDRISIPDVVVSNQFIPSMKKVLKFSLDGKYIETFDNISVITKNKSKKDKIRSCCYKQQKSVDGYQWRYENDCNGTENIEPVKYNNDRHQKIVDAYNADGTFIKTFKSIKSAADYFKIKVCKVSACCGGYQDKCISNIEPYNKITFKYHKETNIQI